MTALRTLLAGACRGRAWRARPCQRARDQGHRSHFRAADFSRGRACMAPKSGFRIGPAAAAPTMARWTPSGSLSPTSSAAHPGLRLEDKGAALAVHFRQAPDLADEVLEFLGLLAQQTGLAVQEGKMVAELKRSAPRQRKRHRRPAGESAFFRPQAGLYRRRFDRRKRVFVRQCARRGFGAVGPAEAATNARYRLPDPASVRAELRRLLADG